MFRVILKESFLFAWHALVSNKLRTFLSLLGITIGIFAIISVFTVVDSLEHNIRSSVASLGENVVFVQKWPWEFGGEYPWWKYVNRPTPLVDELPEVQRRCESAEAVCFKITGRRLVKYQNNSVENVDISCVSHDFDKVKNFEITQGRYFSEVESKVGKPIAIIGSTISEILFGGMNAIGKEIKIGGASTVVVGVFDKEGDSVIGTSMDNVVVVPINYARNLVDIRSERVDPTILVKAKTGISNAQLKDELTGIMRAVRKLKPLADNNFALNETSMLSKGFDGLFVIIGLAGWIIGGFAIIVGGFGIANIMFVSVKERTNLIGIQKALGAKNIFILTQFLIESILLSVLGGIIGLLLVFGIALILTNFMGMDVFLSQTNIILALTISILIGLISGFIPSYTASQLDPVEAIRS